VFQNAGCTSATKSRSLYLLYSPVLEEKKLKSLKRKRPGEVSPGLKVHAGFMKYQFTA
jgi:hypothetical protein